MTQEEIIQFIETRRDDLVFYNGEDSFTVTAFNRLISDLKERI